jgi:hypothetical protein
MLGACARPCHASAVSRYDRPVYNPPIYCYPPRGYTVAPRVCTKPRNYINLDPWTPMNNNGCRAVYILPR